MSSDSGQRIMHLSLQLPQLLSRQLPVGQHCHIHIAQCGGSALDLRAVQVEGQDFLLCLSPGDQLSQKGHCCTIIQSLHKAHLSHRLPSGTMNPLAERHCLGLLYHRLVLRETPLPLQWFLTEQAWRCIIAHEMSECS